LPAVALSLAFTTIVLFWDPHVRDLAAQTFRTELFEHGGFAIWNGSWYGGHYTLTYSVLLPPTAALVGARTVGALSVVLSAYLFDRLVREHWGESAHWATLWFGVGAVSLLVSGQLTFAMGVAFGLLALRCLQRRRRGQAMLARARLRAGQPGRGCFPRRRRTCRIDRWRGAPCRGRRGCDRSRRRHRSQPGLLRRAASSRSPSRPTSAFRCGARGHCLITRGVPGERQFRAVVYAYLLASTAALLLPNPLGGNAIRLGALFGGPLLAAILLTRRPRVNGLLVALILLGSLYWQLMAGIRAVAQTDGDKSVTASYYQLPARMATRPRRAHQSHRGATYVESLGGGLPGAHLRPRPRLASPARHDP